MDRFLLGSLKGNLEDACSVYEQAIAIEKGKEHSQSLPLLLAQYSRFLYLVKFFCVLCYPAFTYLTQVIDYCLFHLVVVCVFQLWWSIIDIVLLRRCLWKLEFDILICEWASQQCLENLGMILCFMDVHHHNLCCNHTPTYIVRHSYVDHSLSQYST